MHCAWRRETREVPSQSAENCGIRTFIAFAAIALTLNGACLDTVVRLQALGAQYGARTRQARQDAAAAGINHGVLAEQSAISIRRSGSGEKSPAAGAQVI